MTSVAADDTSAFDRLARALRRDYGLSIASFPRATLTALLGRTDSLHTSDPEWAELVCAACCIGETMFLRHREQFDVLMQLVAECDARRERRPIKVWSAGCAGGEEAYSIAALLILGGHFANVTGTDVNARFIARARAGVYRPWSLRGVDPLEVAAWIEVDGVRVTVKPTYREQVAFDVLNLAKDPYPQSLDIVFCRNVLIYFEAAAIEDVYRRMALATRPGGLLFTGYSDPEPPRDAGWVSEFRGSVRFYRREATERQVQPVAPAPLPTPPAPDASQQPGEPASAAPASVPPAAPLAAVTPEDGANERFGAALAMARGLSENGRWDDALATMRELIEQRPESLDAQTLFTLIALDAGRQDEALSSARASYFLAPDEPIASYLLAACLDRRGQAALALVRYREARAALERLAGAKTLVPFGGGLTVHQLRRMIDVRLER